MEITGKIYKVIYYHNDNGYGVVLFRLSDSSSKSSKYADEYGSKTIHVVGTFDRMPMEKEEFVFYGEFERNKRYGIQFSFKNFNRPDLNNKYSLIGYFASDLFPGVGEETAKKIVKNLGTNAINKIINDKECLRGVVKDKLIDTIYETVKQNEANQDAMLYFINLGVSMEMVNRFISVYGVTLLKEFKNNPYCLMESIPRFGFLKNDALAIKAGFSKDSNNRLIALIKYVLIDEIYECGNSYLEKNNLFSAVNKYLKEDTITFDKFEEILLILAKRKDIVVEGGNVFSYDLFYKEKKLASFIAKKLIYNKANISEATLLKAFKKCEKNQNIELTEEQKEAVIQSFTEPIMIITGGPGTGKSTIIRFILDMYVKLNNNNENSLLGVALLAPTGKASKRLQELTKVNAQTVHKFLGYTGENHFEHGPNNKVDAKLIIIDEASMMDLPLTYQLFASINEDTRIILTGDVDQLPSVGPGQILKDLIDSKEIKTMRLTKIHRQVEDSKIIQLSHDINEGILPENFLTKYPDRIYIPCDSDNICGLVKDWVTAATSKGKSMIKDIQVLAPMYKCATGINELNDLIQNVVNQLHEGSFEIKSLGQNFRIGDKVIQLINRTDKNIMNGDIGIISDFTFKDNKPSGIIVNFDIGPVEFKYEELEELKLAYTISIHKSQGSEFDIVIMPLSRYYRFMFKRKLIYTACTRAKTNLILIGEASMLQKGIEILEANRLTLLKELIINFIQNPSSMKDMFDAIFENEKSEKTEPLSSYESLIGEDEADVDNISPYDFKKKNEVSIKSQENKNIEIILNLGEEEIEI